MWGRGKGLTKFYRRRSLFPKFQIPFVEQEKPRPDFPGQVNFALRQVKIEVQWPRGKLSCESE